MVSDRNNLRYASLVGCWQYLNKCNLDYQKTNWKKTRISLGEILKDIALKLDLAFKEKNQKLDIKLEEDLPNIVADKDGIERVILNILSNAIKYTQEYGEIYVLGYKEQDNVVIKIKDNGLGISEQDQERIFERFYRVEKGRSRELGGTGLGLSIAKEIIEAHNGMLSLKSELGKGTEVSIKLPYKEV